MDFARFGELAVLSGTIGLGAYCMACAWHVWWLRNAGERRQQAGRRVRFCARALAIAGVLLLLGTLLAELFLDRKGVLKGNELVTVRADKNVQVDQVTDRQWVEPGDTLVRFTSPDLESKAEVLRLKRRHLVAQQQAVSKTPLLPTSETTRHLQEVQAKERHLKTTMHEVRLERERIVREQSMVRLTRESEITQLQRQIDSVQDELEQAIAQSEYQSGRVERSEWLHREGALSIEDLKQIQTEATINAREVSRLKRTMQQLEKERDDLRQNLSDVIEVTQQQAEQFERRLLEGEKKLKELQRESDGFDARLKSDLQLAKEQRQQQIEQLNIELEQTEKELSGVMAALQRKTATAGKVVYRCPSPETAADESPLITIAPDGMLRVEFRLPTWQAHALSPNDDVRMELIEPVDDEGNVSKRFIVRRFTGQLHQVRPLTDDSQNAVAEFAVAPPGEAVSRVASGEDVEVQLLGLPPLYRNPWVQLAAALLALAAVARLVAGRLGCSRTAETALTAKPRRDGDHVRHEVGSEGAMLLLLGNQLRQCVESGEIDEYTIAASEWALDRHRARAVRLLSMGMGEDDALREQIPMLFRQWDDDGRLNTEMGVDSDNELERLFAILRVIGSEAMRERIKTLQTVQHEDASILSSVPVN